MDTVTVAELKARLSHYLREVRAGRSYTVLSRDIPVATLGPWEIGHGGDLEVIDPDPDAVPLQEPMRASPPGLADGAELIRRDREASDARLGGVASRAQRHRGGQAGGEAS